MESRVYYNQFYKKLIDNAEECSAYYPNMSSLVKEAVEHIKELHEIVLDYQRRLE